MRSPSEQALVSSSRSRAAQCHHQSGCSPNVARAALRAVSPPANSAQHSTDRLSTLREQAQARRRFERHEPSRGETPPSPSASPISTAACTQAQSSARNAQRMPHQEQRAKSHSMCRLQLRLAGLPTASCGSLKCANDECTWYSLQVKTEANQTHTFDQQQTKGGHAAVLTLPLPGLPAPGTHRSRRCQSARDTSQCSQARGRTRQHKI